jgi:aminomethyltransferase
MGEILISEPQALDYIQYLTPNNAARVNPSKAQYSALTTPQGTFVDDLLVYCLSEERYLLVVNAANIEKDYSWISKHTDGFKVVIENLSYDYSQLALQGRRAQDILKPLTDISLDEMKPFSVARGKVADIEAIVSRTGYTGEDGFEIYTLSDQPEDIWEAILGEGKDLGIKPVGLGARDTLRLEAALMLYGNDIDETTTVMEAGLKWLVKFEKGDFLGRDELLKQKNEGLVRKIAGFEVEGRGIARSHYPVFVSGERVSEVTSGTYSPFLKKSIGLTYLPIEFTEVGTEFEIDIRGDMVKAKVIPLPFYRRSY